MIIIAIAYIYGNWEGYNVYIILFFLQNIFPCKSQFYILGFVEIGPTMEPMEEIQARV